MIKLKSTYWKIGVSVAYKHLNEKKNEANLQESGIDSEIYTWEHYRIVYYSV